MYLNHVRAILSDITSCIINSIFLVKMKGEYVDSWMLTDKLPGADVIISTDIADSGDQFHSTRTGTIFRVYGCIR